MNDTAIRVSICADCLMADAGYTEDISALALANLAGYVMGPDYDIDDPEAHDAHADGYFSWGMCDGCGSTLGGQRWDMVAVPR